jgi:hypothetical protein
VYAFRAELWQYEGPGAWYFVSLPLDVADGIRAKCGQQASGFGSIKVEATVGSTRWATSLFPDKTRGTYLLPIKKAVRVAESLEAGDMARGQPPGLIPPPHGQRRIRIRPLADQVLSRGMLVTKRFVPATSTTMIAINT